MVCAATREEDMPPRRVLAVAALLALAMPFAAAQALPALPFRDPTLPLETRVDDLVGRLTLDEKWRPPSPTRPAR